MGSWKSPNLRSSVAATVLLVAGLAAWCFSGPQDARAHPLQVRAHGRDFRWHFTLPGPDKRFDTDDDQRTSGGLRLTQGTAVTVEVTSGDYLYAFKAPGLGLLEMAMPGMTFRTSFVASRTGRFDLLMDPACAVPLAERATRMGWLEIVAAPVD